MKQYDLIVAEAARLKLPEAYHDDLFKHDKAQLEAEDPEVFGWFIHDCGTHMHLVCRGEQYIGVFHGHMTTHWDEKLDGTLDWLRATAKTYAYKTEDRYTGVRGHWYLYRDGKLKESTPDRIKEALIEWVQKQKKLAAKSAA